MLQRVLEHLKSHESQCIQELSEFLRFESISASPAHRSQVVACSQWLADRLRSAAGMEVELIPTAGHPVVLAKNTHQPNRPTVLFYGHYDVQPPDPLDKWLSGPFEPTIRNGAIYARGASDDKGQVWAHVQAMSAWHRHGGAPVNIIMLIEGEEEIGSEQLPSFIAANRARLTADVAVISDTNQFARDFPALTYGLRGLVYSEVFCAAAEHDLHSGLYGGAVANPAVVLCRLLGTLHDERGRVNIPGFYDDVIELSQAERDEWRRLPFDEARFAEELGLTRGQLFGESGYSTLERKWARPTCDINGLTSGYQGPGTKTVIPATASAKVSMRLVPNQDPENIRDAFERTLIARCPPSVKLLFQHHGGSAASLTPIDSKAVALAMEALEEGFGVRPTLMREGGTIPVVQWIKRQLGIDTLLIGFGLPDDRLHSPNEKFDLGALHAGARTAAVLYERLREL